MYRARSVLALVLLGSSMVAMAWDSDANRIRSEILTKADSLFKQRYTPRADKPLRAFDKDTETRPADAVIYWFDANYVVRLLFATDGSLVRVEVIHEGFSVSMKVWKIAGRILVIVSGLLLVLLGSGLGCRAYRQRQAAKTLAIKILNGIDEAMFVNASAQTLTTTVWREARNGLRLSRP